jgi:hypothetical protein
MDEIKAVLKKRDCMAFINLGSRTHGEFLLHVESSWSIISFEEAGGGEAAIRVRAKGVKQGSQEHENLEASVAFVCGSADIMNRFAQVFYGLKAMIDEISILEHNPVTNDRITNDDRENLQ